MSIPSLTTVVGQASLGHTLYNKSLTLTIERLNYHFHLMFQEPGPNFPTYLIISSNDKQ